MVERGTDDERADGSDDRIDARPIGSSREGVSRRSVLLAGGVALPGVDALLERPTADRSGPDADDGALAVDATATQVSATAVGYGTVGYGGTSYGSPTDGGYGTGGYGMGPYGGDSVEAQLTSARRLAVEASLDAGTDAVAGTDVTTE
jgi:hypothetical protein